MNIKISNKIYIEDAPITMVKDIKKALTLDNPVYKTLLRRVKFGAQNHRCLYAVKKEFKYYEYDKDNNVLIVGRGLEGRIRDYCESRDMLPEWYFDLVEIPLKKRLESTNLKLRDYQQGIVPKILEEGSHGVIKLGTGYGKTLIALEIIRKLSLTALIIVPRVSILNQFKQELKKNYDYEAGIIQGKTWDIKDITVASMATLKRNEQKEISEKFSICIADECHTVISEKGIKTIGQFKPRYLYGLTATPRRTGEQGEAIFFTFGPIFIDKSLPQKTPQVQIVKSDIDIPVSIDYAEMILDQIENEDRNKLIATLAEWELANDRKILILTKRIDHYNRICAHIKMKNQNWLIHTISSETPQAERDILLTKLRNNEESFDIILGTFSMLSTGVDIPSLDTLIIAGDLKSSVLTEQSSGRILRILSRKKHPKVIDIDDNINPMLHKQALARKRFYKENNWEIV